MAWLFLFMAMVFVLLAGLCYIHATSDRPFPKGESRRKWILLGLAFSFAGLFSVLVAYYITEYLCPESYVPVRCKSFPWEH